MIPSRRSPAVKQNDRLEPGKPARGKSRVPIKEALGQASKQLGEPLDVAIVLLGGTDVTHFHLRVAQSAVRGDFMPSYWSHCGIVLNGRLFHVPLDPPDGFHHMPVTNGIREGTLKFLDDPERFPNVAILRFPIKPLEDKSIAKTVADAIERVRNERGILDLTALILPWLRFVWGAGDATNPLLAGNGIPAAAFVEAVCAVTGLELTPGLASKASCPEAIWQAAKWWHDYYQNVTSPETQTAKRRKGQGTAVISQPMGTYWLGQPSAAIVTE